MIREWWDAHIFEWLLSLAIPVVIGIITLLIYIGYKISQRLRGR